MLQECTINGRLNISQLEIIFGYILSENPHNVHAKIIYRVMMQKKNSLRMCLK